MNKEEDLKIRITKTAVYTNEKLTSSKYYIEVPSLGVNYRDGESIHLTELQYKALIEYILRNKPYIEKVDNEKKTKSKKISS